MKTSLALAAAALIATSGAVGAKTRTSVISLNGHCDVITLQIGKPLVAGADNPDCSPQFGGGLVGNVKGFGGAIVAGVQSPDVPGTQYVLQIAYPLLTGGAWLLYTTTDGISLKKVESGTYTVQGTATRGSTGVSSVFAQHP